MAKKTKEASVYCAQCKGKTNHKILHSHKDTYTQDTTPDIGIEWIEDNWEIIQCAGCNEVSCRNIWYTSEDLYESERQDGQFDLYPKRGRDIRVVRYFADAPSAVAAVYRETVTCYNENAFVLCAIGLRTIIEGICKDQRVFDGPIERTLKDGTMKIDRKNNLEGKIAGLAENRLLAKANAQALHGHRFLGNDATHELIIPQREQLVDAIDIVEHTLEQLYVLSGKSARLMKHMGSKHARSVPT